MLKKVLLKYKGTIAFYIINGILQITAASLGVVYFQKLLDSIPGARVYEEILSIFVIYGCMETVKSVLAYLDEYPTRKLSNGIYQTFKVMAVKKISRIKYQEYQDIGTGKLIQVIENGAEAGRKILFEFYLQLFKDLIPTVVISLIFLGRYNKQVMIAIAVGYIFVFIITNWLLKYLYAIKKNVLTHEENMSKFSVRGFMELVVFRINKLFKKEIDKISGIANEIVKTRTRIRMIHELFFVLFALIVTAIKLVIIYYGAKQVMGGTSSIGTIVALISFVERIYTPIAIFNVLFVDYKLDKVAYERFLDLMKLPDDINLEQGASFRVEKGIIEVDDVSFKYKGKPVLNNLSLKINGGEKIALVGKSGAGKSTLVKLILGLLKPSGGRILVDGKEISEIKLNDYYDYVTYLSQDAPIFDGTLRENIILDANVPDEEIYQILEKVQLKKFVLRLPAKLDTELGERGVKLSGGERQRLAFARAIFQKSKIIILDEPTSALDGITEEKVINNMLKFMEDRTVIIIAHRLKTIERVDKIYVLEEGRVKEKGNFQSLIERKGLFYSLWKKQ